MNFKKSITSIKKYTLFIPLISSIVFPEYAFAIPHVGKIMSGSGSISQSSSGNTMKILQNSSNMSINWSSFNISSGQKVTFIQPNSSSVAINTVTSANPSYIYGTLSANGIVFLVNPYGITIGPGGMVNTGGFLAAAENMSQKATNNYFFTGTGTVTNSGTISVSNTGNISLVGLTVNNSGNINTTYGTVSIGASNDVELDFTNTNQVLLNVSPNTEKAVINNSGVVNANGGLVQIDAGSANSLAQSAVNISGMVMAETTDGKTGNISINSSLTNGTTTLESTAVIDASAPNGGSGGLVSINGYKVVLNNIAPINVLASNGSNGLIKIDPTTLDIGTASGLETIDTSQSQYLSDNICLTSNISMSTSTAYNWIPFGTSSTPFIGTFNGNGHSISGYSITAANNNGTGFFGYLGSTGTIENLTVSGSVNGLTYNNIGGIVGVNSGQIENSSNSGTIGSSSSGGVNIGGLVGNNIGLIVNSYNSGTVNPGKYNCVGGISGYNSGTIENSYNTSNILGGSNNQYVGGISGYNSGKIEYSYNENEVSGNCYVGGIVGKNYGGEISYSYNKAAVDGVEYIGGIAGTNYNSGAIIYSYNSGNITGVYLTGGITGLNGNPSTNSVNYNDLIEYSYNTGQITIRGYGGGGIAGQNTGTIKSSYNSGIIAISNGGTSECQIGGIAGINYGTITYSYNTARVNPNLTTSIYMCDVGGIVGLNYGKITYSYNTGNVGNASDPNENCIGGIVGFNQTSGEVEYTYNTGEVFGASYIGGVVGVNYGSVINNYYDKTTYTGNSIGMDCGTTYQDSNNYGISTSEFSITTSSTAGVSNLGSFNTWGSGSFQTSTSSAPWFEGAVVSGGGTITAPMLIPAMATATATGNNGSSVYNGSKVSPGYTVAGYTMGGSLSTSSNVNISSASIGPNVGTYTDAPTVNISAPIAQDNIYSIADISGTWNITPLSVTATANSSTMSYGGNVPTLSGILETSSYNAGLSNLSAIWTTPATSNSNVGKYAITPSFSYNNGATSSDFNITEASTNSSAFNIAPAALTFSGDITNPTKIYDGTSNITLTTLDSSANLSGFVNGQSAYYIGATGRYVSPNVGTGITISSDINTSNFISSGNGFSWNNYILPTMNISGKGTITPLSITATASPEIIVSGAQIPGLSGTLSSNDGINNGILNISASWSTSATSNSPSGLYAINPTFNYLNGAIKNDFSIVKASSNSTALEINPNQSNIGYSIFAGTSDVYQAQNLLISPSGLQSISTGLNGLAPQIQSEYTFNTVDYKNINKK